jgi:hypothetical protein
VRSIQLKSLTTVGFEVAEMQVFGEGFVPTAVYHSDIFDMGSDLAVWGNLDWEEDSEGDPIRSRAAISTRSGRDSTPVVFRRIRSDGEDVPWKAADTLPEGSAAQQLAAAFDATSLDVREAEIIYRDLSVEERDAISLTQADYSSLRSAERGSVRDDLDNWSTWSPPYRLAGVRIVSPSPRRYFQFNVDYSSEDLFSAKGLGSLSFDFTSPSLAEQIIAEIRPRQADLGQTTDFSLVIVPELRPSVDRGFNSIVVSTPVRVLSLGRVHMTLPDGTQLEEDFSGADLAALPVTGATFAIVEVADDHFQIDLPLVEASRLGPGQTTILEVDFACVVLRTGTEFTVEAMLEGADEVPQRALAGNARILSQGGITVIRDPSKLAVQVEKRGGLLTNVGVSHRVITPNGDGANDVTSIRFDITDLTSGGDVDVRIYDLSGRLVRVVDTGRYASGRFARDWDGTDRQGNTVPPGIYLYTVGVNADAGDAARSGTIAVAY